MAVELYDLYREIYTDYDVKLLTTSCFDRKIDWMHTIDNDEFAYLLHGGELIFNSSLNFEPEEARKRYIDKFINMNASGLIVALEKGNDMSEELIAYCNENHFPLFATSWQTPFLEITRRFSTILLVNERNETNLIGALKNAIHSPLDEAMYLSCFERNHFFRDMDYTISVLGNIGDKAHMKLLKTSLQYSLKRSIIYREHERLVLLTADYSPHHLTETFTQLKEKYHNLLVGIGSTQRGYQQICLSYKHASTTYNLIGKATDQPILCHDDLDVYQLLTDISDSQIYVDFYQKTLGKLVDYDKENMTDYTNILECFFENECHLANTADAMFFHKNTLKYKLAKIKEILGYDIMSNKNRLNIMLAFRIHRLGMDYYKESAQS